MYITITTISIGLTSGIICAKWAMELGYSQFTQLILLVAGCCFGPLVLACLYVRLLNQRKAKSESGTQFFGHVKDQKISESN